MSEEVKETKKKSKGKNTSKKNISKKADKTKTKKETVKKENVKKNTKKETVKKENVKKNTKKEVTKKEVKKETTNKKSNNVNKKVQTKKEVKPVQEEKIVEVKEEVVEEVKVKKNKKKHNSILLIILGCIILFLLFACVIVRKWYLPSKSYSFDYLNMRTIGYTKDEKQSNKLVSDDNKCIITVTTEFLKEEDLKELGTIVEIKNKKWAKQEFANGVTLLTYHKDMLYIVQMYSEDNDTYNKSCKKSFEDIKKTFNFLKNE